MLIIADIMAVIYYRKNAVWKHIVRILPWVAIGIAAALITGNLINNNQFRIVMVTVVWIMLILMVMSDFRTNKGMKIPENHFFASLMGLAGGFATMIGNSSGPVFALYFLAMKLPKKEFIGTSAWLYLIMNTGKFPLQLFVWKTISANSLLINLISIPVIACGIYIGIIIVKLIPEKAYRYFIVISTLIASVFLFIK
jgi:uncharacterized membrane protein YfcA